MNHEKDKQQKTGDQEKTQEQGKGQEQRPHFEQVNDTYGNKDPQASDAAAEQQRKEAFTERD